MERRDPTNQSQENDILGIITDRVKFLIVVLSPEFFHSTADKFVQNYLSQIDIRDGKRKIIPCVNKAYEIPFNPHEKNMFNKINFLNKIYVISPSRYNDFRVQLYKSVTTPAEISR